MPLLFSRGSLLIRFNLSLYMIIKFLSVCMKNWIIGKCNSRVFISLASMGYESLDYAHARRRVNREVFLNIVTFRLFFQNIVGKIYIHLERFNETVILLALVGYEMIIANEARSLISDAR